MSDMNKVSLLCWGNLLLVLGALNWIIQDKEGLLENGRVVLLEVGRYDPRSLMQGDYMQLNYMISRVIQTHLQKQDESEPEDGVVVLALDKDSVGTFRRFHTHGESLAEDEQLLRYKVRRGHWNQVRVAAETFFFQEGMAAEYANARFAELRVDAQGNTLLVALRDQDRKVIGGQKK